MCRAPYTCGLCTESMSVCFRSIDEEVEAKGGEVT